MSVRQWLLAVTCSASIAVPITACSTSTSSPTPSIGSEAQGRTTVRSAASNASAGNVVFAIGITPLTPTSSTAAHRLMPQYVSRSTQSLQILVDGGSPVIVELTPSSPNCLPNSAAAGSYVCKASLTVPSGTHVFSVTTYDESGGKGNVLSTNSSGPLFVKSTGTTTVSIVLQGVVRYAVLSLATTNPSAAQTIALTVVLQDADRNIIVGPAAYDHAVTLTTTNATDGPLSKTTLMSPADASGITVAYDGRAASPIIYSATATSLPPSNVSSATLTPSQPHDSWTTLAPMPTARAAACATAVGRKIYVLGGLGAAGILSINEVYDSVANSWATAAPMPTARWVLACGAVGEMVYAIGGQTTSSTTTTVEAYDTSTNTWKTGLAAMPTTRNSTYAVSYDGLIYVVGGYNSASGRLAANEAYDPATNTWTTSSPLTVGRSGEALAVVGSSIVAADGLADSGGTEDSEVFSTSKDAWTTLEPSPIAQYNVCATGIGQALYVAGGSNGRPLAALEIFDTASGAWASAAPMKTAVTLAAGSASNGRLLCFGGSTSDFPGGTYYNLVQAYQP